MDFKEKQAIYLQIADYVCDNIIAKKWLSEEKIPSIRYLAVSLEVNPNTAMRAYEYLQQQNIIFNKRGIGYFVNETAPEKIIEMRKEQFFENDLPDFFKTIKILNIDFEEIIKKYQVR